MRQVLVLNCGSSSVKYTLFDMAAHQPQASGSVERIGEATPVLSHRWGDESLTQAVAAADHDEALERIHTVLVDPERGGVADRADVRAVGHRVVHGGEAFVESVRITDEVLATIEQYCRLAPLHNPANLDGIRAGQRFFPDVPHVAVFDTAFHHSMPAKAYLYALPYELYTEEGIRRYGFHGTSHRYVTGRAAERLGMAPAQFTGITCHLGNGCSLAAVRDGRSVDTSMGLTPLEGVPMGTRSGDLDPAILFHLGRQRDMTPDQVENLLQRQSGLLGLSGVSNDLREIHAAVADGNERAVLALEVYAYRIRKYIGAYLAALGRADAVVFTGGAGIHDADLRKRILEGLDGLGLVLDAERNDACFGAEAEISSPDSPVRLLVVPTNEELVIARDAWKIAGGHDADGKPAESV